MRKRNLIITGLVGVVLAAAAVWLLKPSAGSDAVTTEASVPAALTVQATVPKVETWPVEVQASGWLAPWAEAVIASELGGERIVAVNVEVGDTVKAGDVLAELSRESIENSIAELEATLESARAALETATGDAERARKLSGGGSISQQEVASYLSTERQAQASVTVAEAQLATKKLSLANTRIVAVSDGVVSEVSAALGQVVSQGQELFRLIRDSRIEWQAEVPVFQLRGIETGTKVVIPSPFGDVGGTVRRVSTEASQTNGRVLVYVDPIPPEGVPMPKTGILVTGSFIVDETEAVTLPATAITLQDGFSYVFVIQSGEATTVLRERVETGRRRGDRVEILGDFAKDAQVVVSGGAFLSDGSVVKVVEGQE
ncbi:efflux RND transporter periplasmic adaptor subunit [Tabrizicola sp.]|jgi:RND family efflux transporter MFP subunit|uniref:efflux RND transporter periplasmic adaptor subunit n=1 Tax=Tabrizicola sp. TaxID=2005166 RepID=UPI001A38645E|nr:efflux RND transporter periplasmic adaptor subunit [Tabrizicola sp.]MBL9063038.1 efflux RND transporter periplasmic adaptor subunit [Tabrizicola sp.]